MHPIIPAFAAILSAPADDRGQASAVPNMAPPQVHAVAPPLAAYTNEVLFGDLWTRDGLSPRDRSLVTIVALIANGQSEQLPFHLNRALDNGLTQAEVGEIVTHLAFYAGWPRAMSAVPVVATVFEARDKAAD